MTPEKLDELERLAKGEGLTWHLSQRAHIREAFPDLIAAARREAALREALRDVAFFTDCDHDPDAPLLPGIGVSGCGACMARRALLSEVPQ